MKQLTFNFKYESGDIVYLLEKGIPVAKKVDGWNVHNGEILYRLVNDNCFCYSEADLFLSPEELCEAVVVDLKERAKAFAPMEKPEPREEAIPPGMRRL